jgi:hypothetical protein
MRHSIVTVFFSLSTFRPAGAGVWAWRDGDTAANVANASKATTARGNSESFMEEVLGSCWLLVAGC